MNANAGMRSSRKLKHYSKRHSVKHHSAMSRKRALPSLAKINPQSEPIQNYIYLGKKLQQFDDFLVEQESDNAISVHGDLEALVYTHNEKLIEEIEHLKTRLRAKPAANLDDMLDMFAAFKL